MKLILTLLTIMLVLITMVLIYAPHDDAAVFNPDTDTLKVMDNGRIGR